jgi:hypothetical protein
VIQKAGLFQMTIQTGKGELKERLAGFRITAWDSAFAGDWQAHLARTAF